MEGAHPLILRRLAEINLDKNIGYGLDPYCDSAREAIRDFCDCPGADVLFTVGGTQTNAVVIDALLSYNESILAAATGHINVHESGAIEACGHKVKTIASRQGKIDLDALEEYLATMWAEYDAVGREHYAVERAVYISQPTELGTLYSLAELQRLRAVCDRFGLRVFLDGARLGYGLGAPANDVSISDIARLVDVFYIGGTKVGALMGEAIVVPNPEVHITRGMIKRRGALLAKGWLLGVQFDTLIGGGLYVEVGRNAVAQAMRIRQAMVERGFELYLDSPTNQQFFVVDNETFDRLSLKVGFDTIARLDAGRVVIRLCTSWATTDSQVDELIASL